MARVRSPNYPQFSLPEAISRIQKIHAAEQHLAAPKEVMARHLGYGGMNGGSSAALSALVKYGLLEDASGDKMKVSQLALAILHPKDKAEKAAAIKDAAARPSLFVEIESEWPNGIPSDQNLRAYLIRRNFAADAVDRVIKSYRETQELVTSESGGYDPDQTPLSEPAMQHSHQVEPQKGALTSNSPPQTSSGANAMFQIEDAGLNNPQIVDRGSTIFVSGLVDRKGLDRLIKKLTAYKAVLDASSEDDEDDI